MGCDVHIFAERKDKKYNYWERVNLYRVNPDHSDLECVEPWEGRNYDLFSLLAGVRGCYESFDFPRGIPNDVSLMVEKEYNSWGGECHSASWYDLYELSLFIKGFIAEHPDDEIIPSLQGFYDSIIAYLEFAGEYIWSLKPNQYRIVFWFDN